MKKIISKLETMLIMDKSKMMRSNMVMNLLHYLFSELRKRKIKEVTKIWIIWVMGSLIMIQITWKKWNQEFWRTGKKEARATISKKSEIVQTQMAIKTNKANKITITKSTQITSPTSSSKTNLSVKTITP